MLETHRAVASRTWSWRDYSLVGSSMHMRWKRTMAGTYLAQSLWCERARDLSTDYTPYRPWLLPCRSVLPLPGVITVY